MCDKAVNKFFFVFDFIPDQYNIQEMCDTAVSNDPFLIVYCPDKYKTQSFTELFTKILFSLYTFLINI